MGTNPGSQHQSWWYRHAAVTIGGCGLVGASIGYAVANSIPEAPMSQLWAELLRPAASLAASTAGILIGVLAGFLLVGVGRRGTRCPRCGTLNEDRAPVCSACSLSLR